MLIKTDKLERFFLFFLFVNPFLDILSGVYIKLSETYSLPGVTPSLLVRMAMLLLFAVYVLLKRNWRAVLVMVPIFLAWALSLAGELTFFYSISLYADVQYIVRFCFNLAVILVYAMVFNASRMSRRELLDYLNRALVFGANMLSLSIVLSYIFEVGYATYGDRFGYRGSRGFFYSGNDITAVLMMLLPMVFVVFFQLAKRSGTKRIIWYAAAPATTMTALLLIGTKTAFLAFGCSVGVMLIYSVVMLFAKGNRTYITRFSLAIIAFACVFTVLMLASNKSVATDIRRSLVQPSGVYSEGGLTGAVLSGRQHKLVKAISMLQKTMPYSIFFGIGRGTQPNIIEMDLFEVAIYYGAFGFLVMLWLYFKLGISFVFKCLKRFDVNGLALFVSIGMGAGYLIMAGHVLFSVTSGFYFALLLVYSQLYYAAAPRKVKVV